MHSPREVPRRKPYQVLCQLTSESHTTFNIVSLYFTAMGRNGVSLITIYLLYVIWIQVALEYENTPL